MFKVKGKHLWYAKDEEGKICYVSIIEANVIKYIKGIKWEKVTVL